MTSAPPDLVALRSQLLQVTGLSATALGIAPDAAHLSSGGYHVGVADIRRIGRWNSDYSTRQARDRSVGGNMASAVDVGSAWRNGGRAAWLRFNNLLYQEMRDRPQNLPALRAINVSLDGRRKQRYDQLHRGDGLIASADTVDTHTHLSFWRDSEGRRAATLARIVELARAAVNNTTPEQAGDDMADFTPADVNAWRQAVRVDALRGMQETNAAGEPMPIVSAIKQLQAAQAASAQREQDMLTALTALAKSGTGSIDVTAVLARIDERTADVTGLIGQQAQRIAELEAELEQERHARHAAAQAEADATADKP